MSARDTVFVAGQHHMEMASGAYVDLLDPDPAMLRLDDIAHHLSQINRYTGATRRPLSVAEHAVLVADRLRSQGHGAATILRGLHHDDPEAYLGDVGRPLKLLLGSAYSDLEVLFEERIRVALKLPLMPTAEARAAIKAADDWALAAEAWHLLPSRGEGWFCWGLYDPEDVRNPPHCARLHSGAAWGVRTPRVEFLREHRRWTKHVAAVRRGAAAS